jgi:hypothetical protein
MEASGDVEERRFSAVRVVDTQANGGRGEFGGRQQPDEEYASRHIDGILLEPVSVQAAQESTSSIRI